MSAASQLTVPIIQILALDSFCFLMTSPSVVLRSLGMVWLADSKTGLSPFLLLHLEQLVKLPKITFFGNHRCMSDSYKTGKQPKRKVDLFLMLIYAFLLSKSGMKITLFFFLIM